MSVTSLILQTLICLAPPPPPPADTPPDDTAPIEIAFDNLVFTRN